MMLTFEAEEEKESSFEGAGFEELIDHLGRLLADEYVMLMKRNHEVKDESSNLRQVFKRESKAGEY